MPRSPKLRWRATQQSVTLASSQGGTIRAAFEAVQGAGLALYSKRDQKIILTTALEDAAFRWVKTAWPLRFTEYAHKKLGYHRAPHSYVKRAPLQPAGEGVVLYSQNPLVDSGEMGSRSMTGATIKAIGVMGTNPRVSIRLPMPHPLKARDKAVVQRIPRQEIQEMARVVEETATQLINSGRATGRKGRRALTGATSEVRL